MNILCSVALGWLIGSIEGIHINDRTRLRKPPMKHTWSVFIRFVLVLTITVLFDQWRNGITILAFCSAWFAHLPAHRIAINLIRSTRYGVKWYDMGKGWYDGIWVTLFAENIERADDDDEKRGFWTAFFVEASLTTVFYVLTNNNT